MNPLLVVAAGWAVPGLGHLLLGRWRQGVVFLLALPAMFLFGLLMAGRLFPFDFSQPLVALAAVGEISVGLVYFLAAPIGYGGGKVVAVTYEYANAFLIVAGLLNLLVILDAYDAARGRK
jgi:hypothetical protein